MSLSNEDWNLPSLFLTFTELSTHFFYGHILKFSIKVTTKMVRNEFFKLSNEHRINDVVIQINTLRVQMCNLYPQSGVPPLKLSLQC